MVFTGKAMIPVSMRLASNLADRNWVITYYYMLKNIFHELLIVIDPVI